MRTVPTSLNERQRSSVERTIEESCAFRRWALLAVNARTDHVHRVVTAPEKPERVINVLKSRCTPELWAALIDMAASPGSRHGSTVYLWDEQQVSGACDYVVHGKDKAASTGSG